MGTWAREPRWTRRAMVQSTSAAALAAGLGIGHRCCHGAAQAAQAVDAVTTLARTAILGDPRVAGLSYRRLEPGSGWPVLVRNDLLVTAPTRAASPTPLVSFVHLTDIHIIDAASPGHPAFVRQYPGSLGGISFTYAFRPQETLTTHVVDMMIRRLNAVGEGPISGRPFDFAISTGDNADSRGAHEMESLLTAFNGGEVSFNAAGGEYVGIQDNSPEQPAATYDAYWHPEAPPSAFGEDSWKREHGFPTFPGFLEAISTPIDAAGLEMPWYGGFGNHDAILLGLLPDASGPAKLLEAVAPTDQMLVALPTGMTFEQFLGQLATATDAQVAEILARMITRTVPAAASRASFTRREFVQMHLDREGRYGPHGHGFSQENVDRDTAYYQFSMAPGIVGFMLDTTNTNGGSDGSLDPEQAAWLEAELVKVHGRYLSPTGQWVETSNENHLVVLFSHHNSFTLENLTTAPGEPTSDRLNWAAFKALIQRFPNVILWVNGHNHTNRVLAHVDPSGNTGGLWEINTAAHVDYPQQSRIVEMLDNQNGVLSITGVMVDAGDAELIPSGRPTTPPPWPRWRRSWRPTTRRPTCPIASGMSPISTSSC